MKKIITYIVLTLCLSGHASAQTSSESQSLQSRIEDLVSDPALSQAVTGIYAGTVGGKVLVDIDAGKMLVPASNMKLISTGAALHALGHDYQFETSIAHDGKVIDGTLHGNLYIIGGGDPTTGSKDSIAVAIEHTFGQWAAIIKAAGIKEIKGHIVGDGRFFEGMAEEPTWLWNDIGTYYGSGTTGLMFYENMVSFSASAGQAVGDPINIKPYYPETPWMKYIYSGTTGKAGTGDRLYMYTSDLAPIAEIRGTFGIDREAKRVDCANKFPEYTCAWHFCRFLEKKGIGCSEGPADFRLCKDSVTWNGPVTVIGSTFSPTLDRIVFETNHASNNVFAETLFRMLGKERNSSACYDSSYVALDAILKSLGLDTSKGLKVQDGSGLSRQNHVSPEFFGRFLKAMTASPCFDEFLTSLPVPGGNGSMQYNMKGQPANLRNRIKVKSGSMNGVRCYSGYILPSGTAAHNVTAASDDIIVFSIMTNNCTAPTWKVRPLLDKMMIALASGN